MRIVPPIRPIRDGKILDVNLINHIIQRTEYGAELLARYKMVAGLNIFVEQAGNGLGVSYLTALAGGAGNPVQSGSAGTGNGGAGTGTGGAGTGTGGAGTPKPATQPYRIAGTYGLGGRNRIFIYDGSTYTDIYFGNDKQILGVGWKIGISGLNLVGSYLFNGDVTSFFYNGLIETEFRVPNSRRTDAFDIDGSNICGSYNPQTGRGEGFFYNGSTYTDLIFPPNFSTLAYGVDGSNVVGSYLSGSFRGFLYNGSTFTDIFVPGSSSTLAHGIDGSNIVGRYALNGVTRGFLYNGSTFVDIFVPGSSLTSAYGIIGSNIVGYYTLNGVNRGFLYNGTTYTDIFVPGSSNTVAFGID